MPGGVIVQARATTTVNAGGGTLTVVPSGTTVGVLTDSSNSTYINGNGAAGSVVELGGVTASWPGGGRQIAAWRLNITISGDTAGGANTTTNYVEAQVKNGTGTLVPLYMAIGNHDGIQTFTSDWYSHPFDMSLPGFINYGVNLTQADITAMNHCIRTDLFGGNPVRVYEIWLDIDYTDIPVAPTSVTPSNGSTVTTDIPFLTAMLPDAYSASGHPGVKGEWNLATDAGFSANLRDIVSVDEYFLGTGGLTQQQTPLASQLFQGTWYVRGRALDRYLTQGAWSPTNSFVVAHQPSVSSMTPTGDKTSKYNASTTFSWVFTDPSPVDSQTAYQVIVERNDTGASVADTGKVVSTNQLATISIGTTYKDAPLRWKARVWDSDDVVSAYSSNNLFRISDLPVVAITTPVTTATSPAPTVAWTFTASGGRTQASYRVVVTKDAPGYVTPVFDSGLQLGAATSYLIPTPVMVLGTVYQVQLYTVDSVGLQSTTSGIVTATWIPPATPTSAASVITTYNTVGYVNLTWNATIRDTNFYSWRVYRRLNGTTTQQLIYESTNTTTASYRDYMAASGATYQYKIVQVANRFSTLLESADTWLGAVTPVADHYWLVCPGDNSLSVQLLMVTSDSFSDPYEKEMLHIIGRGRKMDVGDRLGYDGSIAAQVRGNASIPARLLRLALENLTATKAALYLRNPFGDVWQVGTGDMQFSRMAGVGTLEYFDVTIPYTQVA